MAFENRDVLLTVLCFMAVDFDKGKQHNFLRKLRKSAFLLWLFLCITWAIAGTYFWNDFHTSLLMIISPSTMIIMWIILYSKRSNIAILIKKLPLKSGSFHQIPIVIGLIIICFLYPGVLSLLYIRENLRDHYDPFFTMSFSSQELGVPAIVAFCTLSVHLYIFFTMCFPCLATYVLSVFWWRCRMEFISIRTKLSSIRQEDLLVVLRRYQATLRTAGDVEEAFASFSFLNLVLHLLNMFSGVSILLLSPPSGPLQLYEILVSLIVIVISLSTGMTIAAEVPYASRRLVERLRELNEKMILRAGGQDVPFLEALLQREPVTFSACGIVYLTRSLILATAGSLLTYSVLIIQFT